MWVRGDGRLVLVRACGLWHQEFAKEGVGDIDKDVSYIYIIVHCFLIKRKWMENIVFLKLSRPSMLIKVSGKRISIYPIKKILKEKYIISNINI